MEVLFRQKRFLRWKPFANSEVPLDIVLTCFSFGEGSVTRGTKRIYC